MGVALLQIRFRKIGLSNFKQKIGDLRKCLRGTTDLSYPGFLIEENHHRKIVNVITTMVIRPLDGPT